MPAAQPRLMVRDVGKRFGQTWVLRGVNLAVWRGQVHAVAGLNGSGKSTLARVVYGAHEPTEGEILLDGARCRFRSPRDALARGVAAVPQDLPVVPDLSVTENVFLGMLPSAGGMIELREARKEAERVLRHLHAENDVPDVRALVGDLDLSGQQLVTVARALLRQAGVIVFDEPTSALSWPAAARMREVIRILRADGAAVLFISQRLEDMLDIADELTVLRDGLAVTSGPVSGFTSETIAHWMTRGEPPGALAMPAQPRTAPAGRAVSGAQAARTVLSVRHLNAARLHDVSLDVRAGELVGLFGLPGSGASEILRAVYGSDPTATGTVILNGAQAPKTVRRRIERGLAYVLGDRGKSLVADLSVAANIALPGSGRLARAIAPRRESRTAGAQIRALNIQPPAPEARVSTLSGGNQQKVITARWLARNPRVWLLDDPTRGVDARAQTDIHRIIRDRVRGGACGLMCSSDPRELRQMCDRGLLISGGRVTAEIDPRQLDPATLASPLEGSGTT